MHIGVIGINHKLAHLQLRERLAQACQRCFATGSSIQGAQTFILLNTCNRTEIYFYSLSLSETHGFLLNILRREIEEEFDQKIYSYFGYDCFLHLSRVTAGLDSAIVAESEIQGQVKVAYQNAVNCIPLPEELHYLFQKVLTIGKKVRADLPISRGMPDLEHAVYQTGTHFFSFPQQAKVLFVGASDVNCKILEFLKVKGVNHITLCNRSMSHAVEISQRCGVDVLEWRELRQWHHYEWIIFGTKAPFHLVSREDLPQKCVSHKLVIDLSVPRNVDPLLGRDKRVTLLNVDQINRILNVRKKQMSHTIVAAEQLVLQASKLYVERFQEKVKKKITFG